MAHSATRSATDKMAETAGQLGEKASAAGHGAQEMASDWTRRAQEGLGAIKEATSPYVEQGREKVEAIGRTVGAQVKEWPLSALLVATGVGLALGFILGRR